MFSTMKWQLWFGLGTKGILSFWKHFLAFLSLVSITGADLSLKINCSSSSKIQSCPPHHSLRYWRYFDTQVLDFSWASADSQFLLSNCYYLHALLFAVGCHLPSRCRIAPMISWETCWPSVCDFSLRLRDCFRCVGIWLDIFLRNTGCSQMLSMNFHLGFIWWWFGTSLCSDISHYALLKLFDTWIFCWGKIFRDSSNQTNLSIF